MKDFLILDGGAIKALGESESAGRPVGKLGGVLCRFSTADDPDTSPERDFFDAQTNFRLTDGMKSPVFYHHGLDRRVGIKEIGEGTLHLTDDGIEIKSEIWLDDPDGAKFYEEAAAGRLQWSSGTLNHLVKRTPMATKSGRKSHHIDFWPLGLDASLTPRAAEPRNVASAIKSLVDGGEDVEDAPPEAPAVKAAEPKILGDYALADAGTSAIRNLAERLGIVLYDVFFAGTEPVRFGLVTAEPPTKEQRIAYLGRALDEFKITSIAIAEAILAGTASEDAETAAKSLAALKSLEILETGQVEGSRFVDHTTRLLDAVGEYVERVQGISLSRAMKAGRVFSDASQRSISEVIAALREHADGLEQMLKAATPETKSLPDDDELDTAFYGEQIRLDSLLSGLNL